MTTTVNAKGQITIPEPLRSKYGLLPGTTVVWIERDGELVLRPVRSAQELHGLLRPDAGERSLTDLLLEERRATRSDEDP